MLIVNFVLIAKKTSQKKRISIGVAKFTDPNMGIICGGAAEKGTSMHQDAFFRNIRPGKTMGMTKMKIPMARDRSNACAARNMAMLRKSVQKTPILDKHMTLRMKMSGWKTSRIIRNFWLMHSI
jgi:hypothetical protein